MAIQIQISDRIWKYLNDRKNPGETFSDVLLRELKIKKESEFKSSGLNNQNGR